ncbi:MAG: sigma-70 family RNA polymerase sigma factor [Bacteroidetes bacterium]|jgi:RNA polymerase sigma factor (sigma-70 family)|nr:sigma-70 family RNA polymerase sigma factor [Bacteroidota bacterium]
MARKSRNKEEDGLLIDRAKQGDEKAYEVLLKKYQKSVYYLIYKMIRNPEDAEDLTQETFAKAFGSLVSFDPKFAFSTWLFKIGSNSAIDFIRRKKMQTLSINQGGANDETGNPVLQLKDGNLVPDEKLLKQQRKEYLQVAIGQLPTRYRQLVILRYFEELSYEEVALELQIPLGTVKAQLHRARELLYGALNNMENKL